MICPNCSADNDRVIDSRASDDGRTIRRRRFCNHCRKRFTTYERVEQYPLKIVKKDGAREPFMREKIERGVERACWKRPISAEQIRALAVQVEAELQSDVESEVLSTVVGRLVMKRLAEFKDVEDFVAELAPLRHSTEGLND
jgi:transcriptional repressor NrdR